MRFAVGMVFLVAVATPVAANPADPPCAVAVVVDRALPDLDEVKRGLSRMAGALAAADRFAVIAFDDTARVVVPLQPAANARSIEAGVRLIAPGDGWEPLRGIEAAHRLLAHRTERCKRVLVMTNGIVIRGLRELGHKLQRDGIRMSAIGLRSSNVSTLSTIADAGGGRVHAIGSIDALERVAKRETGKAPDRDTLAVVVLIDRTTGAPSVELAKEAARVIAEVLGAGDRIAVAAFDRDVTQVVAPQLARDRTKISSQISRLTTSVGANVYPALVHARDVLEAVNADVKHAIVISDGEFEMDGVTEIVGELRSARVTVSAIGVPKSNRATLSAIADAGDGRLYMVEEIGALPRMFVRR